MAHDPRRALRQGVVIVSVERLVAVDRRSHERAEPVEPERFARTPIAALWARHAVPRKNLQRQCARLCRLIAGQAAEAKVVVAAAPSVAANIIDQLQRGRCFCRTQRVAGERFFSRLDRSADTDFDGR